MSTRTDTPFPDTTLLRSGDDDARPRRADGMPQRAGAAMDVHLVLRQVQLPHRRHGDDRESLVDLVEVDVPGVPPGPFEEGLHGADRRRGEPDRKSTRLNSSH